MPSRLVAEEIPLGRMRKIALRILRGNLLCSMATVTPRGRAHINTAYFCYSDDLELFFLSDPRSRHCRNLSTNRSMAVAIFSSSQSWEGADRGLQLFGTCGPARGKNAARARRLYARRFPAFAKWRARLEPGDPGNAYRFYRFDARELKILDEAELGDAVFVTATLNKKRRA